MSLQLKLHITELFENDVFKIQGLINSTTMAQILTTILDSTYIRNDTTRLSVDWDIVGAIK
jgi:hypothetical protein